jgi:hypothetical protein
LISTFLTSSVVIGIDCIGVLGAIKPTGIHRIAKIGYGHLCLREETLSFDKTYISCLTLLSTWRSVLLVEETFTINLH